MKILRDNSYVRFKKRSQSGSLSRPWRMVVVAAVLLVGGYLFVGGDRGLVKYMEMRRQAEYLQVEIDKLELKNRELKARVERIKPGSPEWEIFVRTECCLVKERDIVYRLVEKE